MAELIPLQYRLKAAQKQRLSSWSLAMVVALAIGVSGIAYAFAFERRASAELVRLQGEFNSKSSLIERSRELRTARSALAARMEKIQQLMDDKVLLSLLRNISDGFSGTDALDYIEIDARGTTLPQEKQTGDGQFVVHINGITTNNTSLAELMSRLTRQSGPTMNVVLESSRRENHLDGQVMRFQIICEKADNPGT